MLFLVVLGLPIALVAVIPLLNGFRHIAISNNDSSPLPASRALSDFTTFAPSYFGGTTTTNPFDSLKEGDLAALLATFLWLGIAFAALGLICFIAQIVYACMYKSNVVDRRPEFKGGDVLKGGDFKDACSDCFGDMSACLNGWCCLACRCGDTYETLGVMGYWQLIIILVIIDFVVNFISNSLPMIVASPDPNDPASVQSYNNMRSICGSVCTLIYIAVGAYFAKKREMVREKLGGQGSCCMDFICLWCCTCCSIIQEGRSLDFAQGVQVDCCCKLMQVSDNLVGDAVVTNSGSESE